jgi:hypothetical protein
MLNPQRQRVIATRVKNMFAFAIVLGAIWVIGVFVFWCDVTDSWKNVSRRVGATPYSK